MRIEVNDKDLRIKNFQTGKGAIFIYSFFKLDTIKFKKRGDLQTKIESIFLELDIPFVKTILITTFYRATRRSC